MHSFYTHSFYTHSFYTHSFCTHSFYTHSFYTPPFHACRGPAFAAIADMSAALAHVGCGSQFEAHLPAIHALIKESIGLRQKVCVCVCVCVCARTCAQVRMCARVCALRMCTHEFVQLFRAHPRSN